MALRSGDLTYEGIHRVHYGDDLRVADIERFHNVVALRNGVAFKARGTGTDPANDVRVFEVTTQNDLKFNEKVNIPFYTPIFTGMLDAVTTRRIWVNPFPWKVRVYGIYEKHTTAETTASTLTAYIEKTANGQAAGTGTSIMTGTFNLKGTADTVQTATLSTARSTQSPGNLYVELEQGEGLSWVISGAATELARVTLTIYGNLGNKAGCVTVLAADNTRCIDRMVHVACRPKTITHIACVFGVKAGAAANAMVERLQGTEDEAGGDTLITNDTTGFELDGTANTVQYGTLTATAANLKLHVDSAALSDRLAVDFSGTVTAVRNLVIVIGYSADEDGFEVDCHLLLDAETDLTETEFFIANRDLEFVGVKEVHGTADAGEDIDIERDTGTTAPGSGVGLITDDTGAGFDGGATANTPQAGTLLTEPGALILRSGDRLNVGSTDSDDTMLNVCVTARLKAA